MFSTLESSRETIRSLTLNFNVVLALQRRCEYLWDFRLPRLESLTIGVWSGIPICPAQFARFIVAHGETLVELGLAYAYNNLFDYTKLFGEYLRSDSLPNLTIFRGHTYAFLEMVDARMECLRLLRTLEIGSSCEFSDPPTSEFHKIFDGIDRWQEEEGWNAAAANEDDKRVREPILRSLIHLRLELKRSMRRGGDTSIDDIHKVMERCAEHFGKTAEDWTVGGIDHFPIKKEDIFPILLAPGHRLPTIKFYLPISRVDDIHSFKMGIRGSRT
jgi:hypothetical protein